VAKLLSGHVGPGLHIAKEIDIFKSPKNTIKTTNPTPPVLIVFLGLLKMSISWVHVVWSDQVCFRLKHDLSSSVKVASNQIHNLKLMF
jgi:hypothetical protein